MCACMCLGGGGWGHCRLPDVIPCLHDQDPLAACFVTAAGITGHIITLVLFLMMTSSIEFIR